MGPTTEQKNGTITRKYRGETLRIEPWSRNCIRVRATRAAGFSAFDWAINPRDAATAARVESTHAGAVLQCGKLSVEIPDHTADGPGGIVESPLRFFDTTTGRTLLEEKRSRLVFPIPDG